MESMEQKREALPILQPATEADIEILLELERSVSGSKTYSPMLDEKEWMEEVKHSSIFLIRSGGEIAGSVSYEVEGAERVHISGVVIKPEFQGRGIAKEALKQVLNQYASVRRIDLETHPDNPALKLYESLGFKVESRVEDYWGDGEPRLILALERNSEG